MARGKQNNISLTIIVNPPQENAGTDTHISDKYRTYNL